MKKKKENFFILLKKTQSAISILFIRSIIELLKLAKRKKNAILVFHNKKTVGVVSQ